MFERFTDGARRVVVHAQEEARRRRDHQIGTEHLLLGLLAEEQGIAATLVRRQGLTLVEAHATLDELVERGSFSERDADALRTLGIDLDVIRDRIEANFGRGALERAGYRRRRGWFRRRRGDDPPWHIPLTRRATAVLERSLREALDLRHRHIGTEHLLLALLAEGQGLGVATLAERGVDPVALRRQLLADLRSAA